MTYTATEAKNKFGEVLEKAYSGPVTIAKNGKNSFIVTTIEEYEAKKEDSPTNFDWLKEI